MTANKKRGRAHDAGLQIAADLSLPVDAVTQAILIVAKRRTGKSYLARRLVEQLHHQGQQVCILDPKGDWWGILSSADGKGAGLPFVILGGEHGHIPLEPSAGEVVAKFVVEERVSVVIDLSLLRKHEFATFNATFLETLYRLKATERFRTPCMVAMDEADAIAPQKPQPNEARMLGAAEDLVRRGGQRGLGCIMITQRSAVLNKNVLTQAQILIALRTISPQDTKALEEWIAVHGEPKQQKILLASLPSLPVGDAWVWSPGWPDEQGIFDRMHTLPIETFDSGATPKAGEQRIEPKKVADVDLEAVRVQMAETIERAKQADPKALRARIGALEEELRTARAAKPEPLRVEVPVLTAQDRAAVKEVLDRCDVLSAPASQLRTTLAKVDASPVQPPSAAARPASNAPRAQEAPRTRAATNPSAKVTDKLGGGERKILIALAQYPGGRTKKQVAILAGYAHGGGAYNNYLSALRTQRFIEGRDTLAITAAGLEALGTFEPLPTGQALRAHWMHQLGKAERAILTALCDAYPKVFTKDELAAASGYEPGGGGYNNALSRLRTLELLRGRGEMIAASELF